MHEEVIRDLKWVPLTALHFSQEVLTMKLVDFFNVPKDDAAFAAESLGYVWTL